MAFLAEGRGRRAEGGRTCPRATGVRHTNSALCPPPSALCLLLPVQPELRQVLAAAPVVALVVEVLHPRLGGDRVVADRTLDVVLLLADVALDIENLLLAIGLVDRRRLLLDHVSQLR